MYKVWMTSQLEMIYTCPIDNIDIKPMRRTVEKFIWITINNKHWSHKSGSEDFKLCPKYQIKGYALANVGCHTTGSFDEEQGSLWARALVM